MLIGSMISFGILLLSWLILPVKATEVDAAAVGPRELASGRNLP